MSVGEMWRRVVFLFRRERFDRELAEEMEHHLAMKERASAERGMPSEQARHAARREFGNALLLRERSRDAWGWGMVETLLQDLRYGVRMLRKSPSSAVVAVITLALGIGANTALFSVTYGILLKPLPYPESSRLVQLWEETGRPELGRVVFVSSRDFREIASQSRSFEQWGEYEEGGGTIAGPGLPESVSASDVSGDFFSVLGARPLLGRPILPSDTEPGHNHVAVLSYALWQRRYGGDSRIVGKQIQFINEGETGSAAKGRSRPRAYTVAGVMPLQFNFPGRDLYLPQVSWAHESQLIAIGRLKRGVSLATANAELHTIAGRLAAPNGTDRKSIDFSVGLLRDRLSEGYSAGLLILLGATAFVLLLACLNASGVLIARSWTRQHEVAVRETLGATKSRLVRQFLSEGALLSLFGAALGLLLTHWGIDLLRGIAPPYTPRLDEIRIDWVVLGYTLGISALVTILFGLAPALQLTRHGPGPVLKQRGPISFTRLYSRHPQRLKNLLAVGEISLAFVVLVGSALVLRSFSNLVGVKLGFQPEHVLTIYVNFSRATRSNAETLENVAEEVLKRTRALPGVVNSAFGMWMPVGGTTFGGTVLLTDKSHSSPVEYQVASPGYFTTLGIPLILGRCFNAGDRKGSPSVAVVNKAFAKEYFEGSPLGKQFTTAKPDGKQVRVEIIGEVGDTRDDGLSRAPLPEYYIPFNQAGILGETVLFVRAAANPAAIAKAVREQLRTVDPDAPVADPKTMDAVISRSVAVQRFRTILLGAFGGLGLLLAVAGVYGLISYGASQRTHEMGMRMALGAQPRDILRMVLGEGMVLAVSGIVLGIAGALALTRFLRGMLFEIKPTDPATFIGVAMLLMIAALAACYIPARRAMKVDPMEALRYE